MVRSQKRAKKRLGCADCNTRLPPNRQTKILVCEQCRIIRLTENWARLVGLARAFGWDIVLNGGVVRDF